LSYSASGLWGLFGHWAAAIGEVMTMFNSQALTDIRQKKAMTQSDFAQLLDIGKSYLSYLERGMREPSLKLIEKLVAVTGVPAETWLSGSAVKRDIAPNTALDEKNKLNHERSASQKQIQELERTKKRYEAEICLRARFEDILLSKGPLSEKRKKTGKLAVSTFAEGELGFEEIMVITRIERPDFRGLLDEDVNKMPYKCQLLGTEIMASSPGEAGLCFSCCDCIKFDEGKCMGHGNENPHNIVEMLERLNFNGIYEAAKQSDFLKKHRGIQLTAEEIRNIRYKAKNKMSEKIPRDVYYMDTVERTV
jgi:transcriptional regulator with XRE-family HTH domain